MASLADLMNLALGGPLPADYSLRNPGPIGAVRSVS